jgi:hypothetical protein
MKALAHKVQSAFIISGTPVCFRTAVGLVAMLKAT